MAELNSNHKKQFRVLMILFAGLILFLAGLFFYVRYKSTHISTDDAFIKGDIHIIAPRVAGTIQKVYVRDNQYIKKGDLLVEIDPEMYKEKVSAAQAELDSQRLQLKSKESSLVTTQKRLIELKSAVEVVRANYELNLARFKQAETDYKRAERLLQESVISRDKYEKIKTGYDVIRAQLTEADKRIDQAGTAVDSQKAVINQVRDSIAAQKQIIKKWKAKLMLARLTLSYTKVYAPSDGYITRKSVEAGNQIRTGQPLMAVVPLNDTYVIANYKETNLEDIRPGQRVRIKVDAYSGKVFWGKVDSIMAGTGAVFSLFPPENATGNYVKVVKRIPVKIVFEKGTDPEHVLRIGMSVVPTVFVK